MHLVQKSLRLNAFQKSAKTTGKPYSNSCISEKCITALFHVKTHGISCFLISPTADIRNVFKQQFHEKNLSRLLLKMLYKALVWVTKKLWVKIKSEFVALCCCTELRCQVSRIRRQRIPILDHCNQCCHSEDKNSQCCHSVVTEKY